MEAAPEDQEDRPWGCRGTVIEGADGTAVGTGAQNTVDMIDDCNVPFSAARVAQDYTLNGYGDWFLPSQDEALLMSVHTTAVGLVESSAYWTSSEAPSTESDTQARYIFKNPNSDGSWSLTGKNDLLKVRSVRAF